MASTPHREHDRMRQDAITWRQDLANHIIQQQARADQASPLPDGHMLHALQNWQRRITGGSLLEFLEWAASEDAEERYPMLATSPITERVFVFISDVPGLVAYRELVDPQSQRTIGLLKEQWRTFLSDDSQRHDDPLPHHYEMWSVWHREVDPQWDLEDKPYDQLWVHEEGFAIANEAGRGSQNVWNWNGQRLQLVKQDITKWVF